MAAPAADAPAASDDALPEFHRGVIRDVEAVKGELDRLVDKVRSVKELCISLSDEGVEEGDEAAQVAARQVAKKKSVGGVSEETPLMTPKEAAIQILHSLRAKGGTLSEDDQDDLDFAIGIFSQDMSDDVPALADGADEVSSWIRYTYTHAPRFRGKSVHGSKVTAQIKERLSQKTDRGNAVTDHPKYPLPVSAALEAKLDELFSKLDEWEFNVFEVAKETGGHPLLFVGWAVFQAHKNVVHTFGIDENKLRNFLTQIEAGYQENPYHCSTHAADVVQTLHYILRTAELEKVYSEAEVFASIFAAIIHDYEHNGMNNAFHIATRSELSMLYNDTSVLENHHLSAAFHLLNAKEDCNILCNLDEQQFRQVRDYVIQMVLGTDMTFHFETVGVIKGLIASNGENLGEWADLKVVRRAFLHLADISNPAKPKTLCRSWTHRLINEFFNQGDQEKEIGLQISPMCDRTTTKIPDSQIGFINIIVKPTFMTLQQILPKLSVCMEDLERNLEFWMAEKEAAEKSEK